MGNSNLPAARSEISDSDPCHQFWVRLQDCLDSGADPTCDSVIEQHVQGCDDCGARLDASRRMLALFDNSPFVGQTAFAGRVELHSSLAANSESLRRRQLWVKGLAAAACVLALWMPAWWLKLSDNSASVAARLAAQSSNDLAVVAASDLTNVESMRQSVERDLPFGAQADSDSQLSETEQLANAWGGMDARMPLTGVLGISGALDAQLKDAGEMATAMQHVALSPDSRWSVLPLQNPTPALRAGLSPFTSSVGAALITIRNSVMPPPATPIAPRHEIPQAQNRIASAVFG